MCHEENSCEKRRLTADPNFRFFETSVWGSRSQGTPVVEEVGQVPEGDKAIKGAGRARPHPLHCISG